MKAGTPAVGTNCLPPESSGRTEAFAASTYAMKSRDMG
jgi:hypothetical protein